MLKELLKHGVKLKNKIMKKYIGIKKVKAELQVKEHVIGYKVIYPDGYESWSPKEVFDHAYIRTKNPLGWLLSSVKLVTLDIRNLFKRNSKDLDYKSIKKRNILLKKIYKITRRTSNKNFTLNIDYNEEFISIFTHSTIDRSSVGFKFLYYLNKPLKDLKETCDLFELEARKKANEIEETMKNMH